ncbi:DUF6625 family protein [Flavobacterium aquicola]|uniref:Uncharacterized protein n=1 Tax=Flavobacterium aquicola TaxID=1682742 RepID=A0A3E0EPE0_9FLAO|nr:DUF6625 family protein [Flavobacterium aquicola]REH00098.1 hypothetical protein C8P67_10366 [Flavobacterium aquicola]
MNVLEKNTEGLSSLAIITFWYGKYPWYMPYFIHTCKFNPTVDFIIITDNTAIIPDKPENVKVVYKTLEEFKERASVKLGFTVAIETPYKLCDFKPAYGFIFPEIIQKYDFWGHGDIDMAYGNIRNFMTAKILNEYDIISSRNDITTGTFLLYRNNIKMNTLFMQSRDYKQVYTDPEHYCFDECNFLFTELDRGDSILDYPNNVQSMTYLAVKGDKEGHFRAFFDYIIVQGMSNNIRWDNGIIIYDDRFECMFYDLIKYKVKCKNKTVTYPIPEVFYFNKNGINKNSFWKLLSLKIKAKISKNDNKISA